MYRREIPQRAVDAKIVKPMYIIGKFALQLLYGVEFLTINELGFDDFKRGFGTGERKDAALVHKAFSTVRGNLSDIGMFHTDRGSEFKNSIIDDALIAFGIKRSLSNKGCPYDNAVAEATFKIIKTEFVYGQKFDTLEQLQLEFSDYVNWFNNFRIHGSLGYLTPAEFKI